LDHAFAEVVVSPDFTFHRAAFQHRPPHASAELGRGDPQTVDI